MIPRTVAFGGISQTRASTLPPAVALALEPNVERTISLELAEIVSQMPPGLVRPLEDGDADRRVLLKASELERGMANGKPAVSIASVYQQVPEIFVREIAPGDPAQIALPFSAVLEQFSNLQTRSDQQRATPVPQVQTPFLKVTQEDGERFGTPVDPGNTEDLPSVRVEPATARSISAAEPEPAATEKGPATPSSLRPAAPAQPLAETANSAGTAPTRIPFKITPNGTDAPAPERVPASSEPSVPTSLPTVPSRPMRIPFKITAPSEAARPTPEPWLTKASMAAEVAATAEPPALKTATDSSVLMITLVLKPILEMLPPMQLVGDLDEVPSDARIDFPFSLVEPQLASGRVMIPPDQFAAALPPQHASLFDSSAAADPVALPLQEVLKNLPAASLRMRDDQEEQEKGANFETPFSAKAAEDAKRLKVAAAPVAKPTVAAPAPVQMTETAPLEVAVAPAEGSASVPVAPEDSQAGSLRYPPNSGDRTALQTALDTDETLDAKAVVAHIRKMEGVEACAIMFGDGLSLAGNIPANYETEGLCAMAPSLLQRIENHMVDTQLGALRAMTLSCAKAAITFFMHDNLCLAALHAKGDLAADIRDRLGCTVQELSRQYSHPA